MTVDTGKWVGGLAEWTDGDTAFLSVAFTRPMRFAYADPPYLGCGALYAKHHPEALVWDDPETHRALIQRLQDDYPDGWALSMASTNLRTLLPMCPQAARVASWQKPFAVYKPNVQVAYTWEPVVFMGGRKRGRDAATVRDSWSCNITLRRGLTGAKPRDFCMAVFDLLGAQRGDVLDDLFPGTGAVAAAWAERVGAASPLDPTPLEAWCETRNAMITFRDGTVPAQPDSA